MGVYINPGNSGFAEIVRSGYVDKTMLIKLTNETIGKTNKLTCVSRPRRFGKSYAAKMLAAYYDCSCDSRDLFEDRKIAGTADFETHLNKYNVIYLEITSFISFARRQGISLREIPNIIVRALSEELAFTGFDVLTDKSLTENLIRVSSLPGGKKFVFILDEWDAVIREARDDAVAQNRYLDLMREWFKNGTFTPRAVAAAYMTGILPIKKDGSQSAISEFDEYSMIKPRAYGEYVGFTETEVRTLCEKKDIDYETMKHWYDGYRFAGVGSVYNPNSVIKAIRNRDFDSYWTETSAAEGLLDYISRDYNGMTKTIAELVGGVDVEVNTTGFANDLTTFKGKDDVLTLMIHLGYLAYDGEKKTARIPNEEIRQEFQRSIREVKHEATIRRIEESEKLFADTIHGNEDAVAAQIEKVHAEETSPLHYNREDSLRSVIKLAYYTYRDHFIQWEELPAGAGYADILYLPKKDSAWPPILVELKWNKSAKGAISQILRKDYPKALQGYGGEILLVGINYDKDAPAGERKHTCRIIRYQG